MPRVARAPAIPPPPPLPALSLVLTGKVYLVSVKKGRLLTKSAIFDSSLGKNRESSDTQTSVCKHFGPVLFTALQIFYIGKRNGLYLFTMLSPDCRPSGIWGFSVDGHLSNPGTVHVRGRFSGWSPFKPGDRPRQRPFFRMVAFQTRGPSTSEAVFPDGQLSNPGTIHARGYFPGQSACGAGRDGARRPWGVVENIDYYHFFVIFVDV